MMPGDAEGRREEGEKKVVGGAERESLEKCKHRYQEHK